jgi:endonuclease/exonuclease/phosphatase family metal-dependent hydrolase
METPAVRTATSGSIPQLQSPDAAPVRRLTVLNANLWMLPGPLAADKRVRLDRFVRFARQRQPDIITLQEVWTRRMVAKITRAFPEYTPSTCAMGSVWNRGGLLTLTRPATLSSYFTRFDRGDGVGAVEFIAGKGYLVTVVALPGGPVGVINVHLFAPPRPDRVDIAERQLHELLRQDPGCPYFVVGDLNLRADSVDEIAGSRFLGDDAHGYTIDPHNPYTQWGFNALPVASKIDRLLVPEILADDTEIAASVLAVPTVSDHSMTSYTLSGGWLGSTSEDGEAPVFGPASGDGASGVTELDAYFGARNA